jgi:transcriptional regulator with XRE-family HTH domain
VSDAAGSRRLGAFLRAYREHLKPADIGLPSTGRRRTPGLRREEVATLAGIGLAWYTWLEQGRVTASRRVLEALAVALQLDADAKRHMLLLAGLRAPDPCEHDESATDVLRRVLNSWSTSPALLLDRRLDLVAWNEAYLALWLDPQLLPKPHRNLMWLMVKDPTMQRVLPEWESLARAFLWQLRAQADRYPGDERIQQVYSILGKARPDLSHWWACHGVRTFTACPVPVKPPGEKELIFTYSVLRPADDPDSIILLQTPARRADQQYMEHRLTEREVLHCAG